VKIVLLRRPFRARPKKVSWWVEKILLMVGIVAFGLWGAINMDTYLFQMREKVYLTQFPLSYHSPREKPPLPLPLNAGDFIGEIDIPDVGISAAILEGSDEHSLRLGVGHIPGTALPGSSGNVSLAAHRDTFFRPLRKIKKNDEIHLITYDNSYNYRVDWIRVVPPDDINVLRPSKEPTLTLITCYPFYFVGSAPERFVVRAHRLAG